MLTSEGQSRCGDDDRVCHAIDSLCCYAKKIYILWTTPVQLPECGENCPKKCHVRAEQSIEQLTGSIFPITRSVKQLLYIKVPSWKNTGWFHTSERSEGPLWDVEHRYKRKYFPSRHPRIVQRWRYVNKDPVRAGHRKKVPEEENMQRPQ